MNADQDPSEMESVSDAGANAISAPDIGALQTELAVQKDRYLRLAADFDNFRRRTARETERSAAAQKEAFIRELLPVIDNLERALGSEDADGFVIVRIEWPAKALVSFDA